MGAVLDRYQKLASHTLAAAVTAEISPEVVQIPLGARGLSLLATFVRAGGGTTTKAWVQTSFDGGSTWCDIVNFAFTTTSAQRLASVDHGIAFTPAAPTDGTLADNTINNGIFGDRLRVKRTTTGTYTGASSITIYAVVH